MFGENRKVPHYHFLINYVNFHISNVAIYDSFYKIVHTFNVIHFHTTLKDLQTITISVTEFVNQIELVSLIIKLQIGTDSHELFPTTAKLGTTLSSFQTIVKENY